MIDTPSVKTEPLTPADLNALLDARSTRIRPWSPAAQEEYADRIDELMRQRFASDRRGDQITDEEFAEALRWVLEGPRLTTGELLAFLERNKRLPADPDRFPQPRNEDE